LPEGVNRTAGDMGMCCGHVKIGLDRYPLYRYSGTIKIAHNLIES
jgi:hypothetical protein